jgi:hypothetical protein
MTQIQFHLVCHPELLKFHHFDKCIRDWRIAEQYKHILNTNTKLLHTTWITRDLAGNGSTVISNPKGLNYQDLRRLHQKFLLRTSV